MTNEKKNLTYSRTGRPWKISKNNFRKNEYLWYYISRPPIISLNKIITESKLQSLFVLKLREPDYMTDVHYFYHRINLPGVKSYNGMIDVLMRT